MSSTKSRPIKPKHLVVTTGDVGPKDSPVAAGTHGTVLEVKHGRYLVMFGSTPETIREVWLNVGDIERPAEIPSKTRFYASLIGPLLGCYYPMPLDFNKAQCRAAMNTSRLKPLWMSIYPRNEVVEAIEKYGGLMLPDEFAARLDYDSAVVEGWKRNDV